MRPILVYQTAFWGDVLLSIPLLKRIKTRFPDQPLHLVARKGFGEFFKDVGLVDFVHEIDKASAQSRKMVRAALRAQEWDLIVVPHQSVRTALQVFQLKARQKIGFYRFWNGLFFTTRVVRPSHLPDALRQLTLLTPLDSELKAIMDALPRQPVTIPEWASMTINDGTHPSTLANHVSRSPRVNQWIQREHKELRVFVAPGSQWPTKRWTNEGFSTAVLEWIQRNAKVFIVGGRDDAEIANALVASIYEKIDPDAQSRLINLVGETTPTDLYVLFLNGDLMFCNDSGSMHMASVAGLPTVAIFGPTTLELGYQPWQERSRVAQVPLACRPCGKHGHVKCPLGTHECMTAIKSDAVSALAREIVTLR